MMDAITDAIQAALDWTRELWFDLIAAVLGGFAAVVEAIPAPDFLADATSYQMPAGVSWILSAFQIEFGISVYVAAITLRFILRRIPGIG